MDLRSEFTVFAIVVFALINSLDCASGIEEDRRLDRGTCYRGVAVLSSNIGEELTIDEVVDFAKTCKLNIVVIDYTWITHHWPRTDHSNVRSLVTRLKRDGVKVAAMYRPRGMNPSEANVHWAVNKNGAVSEHHNNLCLAHEDSVEWGASWGRKILDTQPEVNRIILYNLLPVCACKDCRDGNGRQHAAVFIDHCRSDWSDLRPNIEIGHVGVGTEYADKVDFVCPFFSVNRDDQGKVNIPKAISIILVARSRLKSQAIIPLVKLCWASSTENTTDDVIEAVTRCTRAKFGFILWYYEWLFHSETGSYDRRSILKAMGGDWNVMSPYYTRTVKRVKRGGLQNNPKGWIYFESKESREGCAPVLSLAFGKNTKQIPASSDVPVMSYLPDRPHPVHPRLSIQLSDANRTLLYFDVPRMQRGAKLDRAELILDMKISKAPVVAPFNLAIHAVTKPWEERSTAWQNQPSFVKEPASVVRVKPQPGILHLDVTDLVLDWMNGELPNNGFLLKVSSPIVNEPLPKPELQLDGVAVVAVKDFMRIENTAGPIENLNFPRYFPAIDDEQIVLARWVTARSDEGEEVEIRIDDVTADPQGNLIHRYQIDAFPACTGVSVTITSLVLRRERPAPEGVFPVLTRKKYPREIQPFLRSTRMIDVDHPEIRALAEHLLGKTHDAYEIAGELAAIMRSNSYKQKPGVDLTLPLSARVLKYGGSCCGSAVAAAAVLRACGVPTQITYCPAGHIHGIIRFYLPGYGWFRMDGTCGVGRFPLVQENKHRGLVRLFDMPIEMEALEHAYAWPYQHNTQHGKYVFLSNDRALSTVRFAARDAADARKAGRIAGQVKDPFPHLEPGSWNTVLDLWEWDPTDAQWASLVTASHDAVVAKEIGALDAVVQALGDRLSEELLTDMIRRLEKYGTLPE